MKAEGRGVQIRACESTHEKKRNQGKQSPSFTSASNGNCSNRGGKDKLEFTEQDGWNGAHRLRKNTSVESMFQIANESIALAISQRVAKDVPLKGDTDNRQ